MAKYDYELKKKVVTVYMSGEGGKKFVANTSGVKAPQDVMKWVKL